MKRLLLSPRSAPDTGPAIRPPVGSESVTPAPATGSMAPDADTRLYGDVLALAPRTGHEQILELDLLIARAAALRTRTP